MIVGTSPQFFTFVAGYIGIHGMAHALETVLEAAALLSAVGDVGPTPVLPAPNRPVIPAGKPEASAMEGSAAVTRGPIVNPAIPSLAWVPASRPGPLSALLRNEANRGPGRR